MKCYIVSGRPDVGKTMVAEKIMDRLLANGYKAISINKRTTGDPNDFQSILKKNGKVVLIHSHCDHRKALDELKEMCKQNQNADVLISTLRLEKSDKMRKPFESHYNQIDTGFIEMPLAKMNVINYKQQRVDWYLNKFVDTSIFILINTPFNL